MEISLQAREIVKTLYDVLLKEYKDPDDPEILKNLNALCACLVFCLYAEDTEIFGEHKMFHNYLKSYFIKETRRVLIDLFQVLDQKSKEINQYLDKNLLAFSYINAGDLFADENKIL